MSPDATFDGYGAMEEDVLDSFTSRSGKVFSKVQTEDEDIEYRENGIPVSQETYAGASNWKVPDYNVLRDEESDAEDVPYDIPDSAKDAFDMFDEAFESDDAEDSYDEEGGYEGEYPEEEAADEPLYEDLPDEVGEMFEAWDDESGSADEAYDEEHPEYGIPDAAGDTFDRWDEEYGRDEGSEETYEEPDETEEPETEEPEEPYDEPPETSEDTPYVSISGLSGYADFLNRGDDVFDHTFGRYAHQEGMDVDEYARILDGDIVGPELENTRGLRLSHNNEDVLDYVLRELEGDEHLRYVMGDNELALMFQDAYDEQYAEEHGEEPADDVWYKQIDDDIRDTFLDAVSRGHINVMAPGYDHAYMHGGTNDEDDLEQTGGDPQDPRNYRINEQIAELADRLLRGEDADNVYEQFEDYFGEDGNIITRDYNELDADGDIPQVVGNTSAQELGDADGDYRERNPQRRGDAVNVNTVSDYLAGHADNISAAVETPGDVYAVDWDVERGQVERDDFGGATTAPGGGPGRAATADGGIPIAEYIDVEMNARWEDKDLEYVGEKSSLSRWGGALSRTWNLLKLLKGEGKYADDSFREIKDDLTGEASDLNFEYDFRFGGDDTGDLDDYQLLLEVAPGEERGAGFNASNFYPDSPDSITALPPVSFADLDWTPGWRWGGDYMDADRVYENPVDPEDIWGSVSDFGGGIYGVRARIVNEDGDQVGNDDSRDALITDWESFDVDEDAEDLLDEWGPNRVRQLMPSMGTTGIKETYFDDGDP